MREEMKEGVRVWIPVDDNDKAFLRIAEGATFNETTFPSGWKSPPRDVVCQGGILVDATT